MPSSRQRPQMSSSGRRQQKPSVEDASDPDNKPTRDQVLKEVDLIEEHTAEGLTSGVIDYITEPYMTEVNTPAASGIPDNWKQKVTARNKKFLAKVEKALDTNEQKIVTCISSLPTEQEREEVAEMVSSEDRRGPLRRFWDFICEMLSMVMDFFTGVIQRSWSAVQKFVSEKLMMLRESALGSVLSDLRLGSTLQQGRAVRL